MTITIFAKKRKTRDGKPFTTYITTLTSKTTGEVVTAGVRFPDDAKPAPADCPLNIDIDKRDANLSSKQVEKANGEKVIARTLWVKRWAPSETVYEDHSLDDYE